MNIQHHIDQILQYEKQLSEEREITQYERYATYAAIMRIISEMSEEINGLMDKIHESAIDVMERSRLSSVRFEYGTLYIREQFWVKPKDSDALKDLVGVFESDEFLSNLVKNEKTINTNTLSSKAREYGNKTEKTEQELYEKLPEKWRDLVEVTLSRKLVLKK